MAVNEYKPAHFELPHRNRIANGDAREHEMRMALADKITDLGGIEMVKRRDESVPGQVDVYVKRGSAARLGANHDVKLFCSLNSKGIIIRGLDRWAKHQVISRGWGKLIPGDVLIFLPRDSRELDVIWKVFERAYDNIYDPSVKASGAHIVSTWDWPQFSRTTLQ
jgi:hypothetical protein